MSGSGVPYIARTSDPETLSALLSDIEARLVTQERKYYGPARSFFSVAYVPVPGDLPADPPDGSFANVVSDDSWWVGVGGVWTSTTSPLDPNPGGGGGGGGSSSGFTFTQPTAPTATATGQTWYNTDTGDAFVWYDSYWVQFSPSVGGGGDDGTYLRLDGANSFTGETLQGPGRILGPGGVGGITLDNSLPEGRSLNVNGASFLEWSGNEVRINRDAGHADDGLRDSHGAQALFTMFPSTGERVVDYGTYTYDGLSATGYGEQVFYSAAFDAPPVLVTMVADAASGNDLGYYVKAQTNTAAWFRGRHYMTNGMWNNSVAATVMWVAFGVRG